ncbi:hypothetical protein DQ239_11200 [Blastococcus sp. TF02-09]|uniref:hypothetical protein n=1 Tax=Blastococcus sp. TF02-09 TaxID=2250576 RepID=UPI000E1421C3|nr:hypothetical protein [Blastococcus sp. TF02-9]RBY77438.1 hypothetical protein DQ239_11200 [Blastococcus sp. TF02-9]
MTTPRRLLAALLAGGLAVAAAGCDTAEPAAPPAEAGPPFTPAASDGTSWAPAPVQLDGLTAVAGTVGDEYRLHTADGDVTFLPGVNLGPTIPGHQPGELAIDAATYRRWFALMGDMGIRVVRIYAVHRPDFYRELRTYNLAHPDAPLYLMAGVYLPDESYVQTRNLHLPGPTAAFDAELVDAVAAVHGDLSRPDTPGHASGTWDADVSAWTAGWIVGAEWDPVASSASDTRNPGAPPVAGRWFTSSAEATPTERWITARLETLAAAQVSRGAVAPVAFVNWSTTDPLRHPDEPIPEEDLAQIDANAARPTAAWQGGYFASYHAYPYFPDFLRYEPALAAAGNGDAYAGYLRALKQHHAGLPVVISEFGVPSSLGSAHTGPGGRDQGDHSEQEAVRTDAAMLRTIADAGLAGGLLFSWTDEWFKFTWNTRQRHVPADRRQLWHDPLTNEQWFGLLAQDPEPSPDAVPIRLAVDDVELTVRTDPGWVHLELRLPEEPVGALDLAFDVVPGGASVLPDGTADAVSDAAVHLDPAAGTGQVLVRRELDPVLLDFPAGEQPDRGADPWVPAQLTTNRPLTVPTTGEQLPAEFFDVGRLQAGPMDPADPGYDSRNTIAVSGRTVTLRLPWSLLGFSDPSSRQALIPSGPRGTSVDVDRVGVALVLDGERLDLGTFTWEPWNRVYSSERVKAGVQEWVDAVADVSRRSS